MSESDKPRSTDGEPPPRTGDRPTPPSSDGLGRAEQIFFEVAGLSPADQSAAIARAAGDDEPLRQQILRLVDSAARVGGFMEQPLLGKVFDDLTLESQRDAAADDLVGLTLGPFRLEKRIASGGMGTVYLAARSDAQFDQRVAIKVVKRGMDTEEIVRRFREERQTLAQLDHPYIARLLDGGVTPDGRPYLVMEYVDGLPIDQYCDSRRVSTTERLKLFRLVCEGVHAAHQSLVIHRDLKPSNILVTSAGIPKLLDFGIAKVISGTRDVTMTAETDRRLTPEYASPEQVAGGPITTASDVYSLGVILYELLSGVRPYSFLMRSTDEVKRVVCGQVPPSPSDAVPTKAARLRTGTASRGVSSGAASVSSLRPSSGVLSTTIEQAPVDHPKTRGVSATRLRSQLRGDLDTIVMMALRKEPQRRFASAEQMGADIGRFLSGMPVQARRDTWLYRSRKFVRRNAAAVVASTLAIIAISGGLVIQTQQKAQIAHQRDQLTIANHRLDETQTFLLDMLKGAQASGKGPSATLGEVLQDAERTIATAPPTDAMTLASVKEAVGTAMMTLGMTDRARPLLEDAFAEFKSQPPDSAQRMSIETELAQLLYYEGNLAEAEAPLRDLLARERALNAGVQTKREGVILNALGAVLRLTRRFDEAMTVQVEALALRKIVEGESSLAAAESHNNIGAIHFGAGRFEDAIRSHQNAMDIRVARLRPGHPLLLASSLNLGLSLQRVGQVEKALPMLRLAVDGWEAAYGPEHPGIVVARTAMGQTLFKAGKPRDAVEMFTAGLRWQQQHASTTAAAMLATRANIAIAFADYAECVEGAKTIREVREDANANLLNPGLKRQLIEALIRLCGRCDMNVEQAMAERDLYELETQLKVQTPPAKPASVPPPTPR